MSKEKMYDLIIVGGGPAGLSAAINAESESLDTLVLDAAPQLGGQAGTSLIENYPGFPEGVSGRKLTALMIDQALRFTTEFMAPMRAEEIEATGEGFSVREDSEVVLGRMVLISSGVDTEGLLFRISRLIAAAA